MTYRVPTDALLINLPTTMAPTIQPIRGCLSPRSCDPQCFAQNCGDFLCVLETATKVKATSPSTSSQYSLSLSEGEHLEMHARVH